jgi:hypothetical protein
MKRYPNIETRPFPGHSYRVGYSNGPWHIVKTRIYGKPGYCVYKVGNSSNHFTAYTLDKVSSELDKRNHASL